MESGKGGRREWRKRDFKIRLLNWQTLSCQPVSLPVCPLPCIHSRTIYSRSRKDEGISLARLGLANMLWSFGAAMHTHTHTHLHTTKSSPWWANLNLGALICIHLPAIRALFRQTRCVFWFEDWVEDRTKGADAICYLFSAFKKTYIWTISVEAVWDWSCKDVGNTIHFWKCNVLVDQIKILLDWD